MANDPDLFTSIKEHGAIAGAIATIIALGALFWRKVAGAARGIWRAGKWFRRAVVAVDAVERIDREVSGASGEKPLRDCIEEHGNRIAEAQREIRNIAAGQALLEDRNREILDLYPIGIFECGTDGQCSWANKTLCEIWGEDLADMLGWGWLRRIHDDDRENTHRHWTTAVETGIPYRGTYRLEMPDGRTIKVKAEATRSHDPNTGAVLKFFGRVEITE